MTARRGLVLAPLVGLLLGTPAAVATARAQTPAYAAELAELDSTTQTLVASDIARAAARGVPSEPLLAKVREGRLKRAPSTKIRIAVAALAGRLDSAHAALGMEATRDELVAGAEAIGAGAPPSTLRRLRAAAGRRPLGASLGALAQLVASGVPPQRAGEMVLELIRRNARPAQMLAFGVAVEADVAAGVPAEESAAFRMHAVTAASDAFVSSPATAEPPSAGHPGVAGQGVPRRRP